MGERHVISALVSKRAELSGRIAALDRDKPLLIEQLVHIDKVLGIFGYCGNPKAIKPIRKRPNRFRPYEVAKLVQRLEREAGAKLPNMGLAARIIESKGWSADDKKLAKRVSDAVKHARRTIARLEKPSGWH